MLADKKLIDLIFEHVGKKLRHEVEGMLIGGNAMIFYGLKESTKDVDMVLYERRDLAAISRIVLSHPIYRDAKILKELPYKIDPELLKKGEPTVIGNKDLPRIELFYKYVFRVDTSKMLENSKMSVRFDFFKLRVVEIENLLFLKAVAGRPTDIDDIKTIVKNLDIDWNKFVEFVKNYNKIDNRPVWFALGNLYDLNKKEKIIPRFVLNEIAKLFRSKIYKIDTISRV